jgi:hypothetical protein
VKSGLGLLSIMYCLILAAQHYFLYGGDASRRDPSKGEHDGSGSHGE